MGAGGEYSGFTAANFASEGTKCAEFAVRSRSMAAVRAVASQQYSTRYNRAGLAARRLAADPENLTRRLTGDWTAMEFRFDVVYGARSPGSELR